MIEPHFAFAARQTIHGRNALPLGAEVLQEACPRPARVHRKMEKTAPGRAAKASVCRNENRRG